MVSKKTEFEQWLKIAEQSRIVEQELSKLLREMNQAGNVPKTTKDGQYSQADDALTELRSNLEDRFFEEHPNKATTFAFYGPEGHGECKYECQICGSLFIFNTTEYEWVYPRCGRCGMATQWALYENKPDDGTHLDEFKNSGNPRDRAEYNGYKDD